MTTVFSKIINREIPTEFVFENDRFVAFRDKAPLAPVHFLIVPKKEIRDLDDMWDDDLLLLAEVGAIAQWLAREFAVNGEYRLLTNCGYKAGQTIPHLHFHLIGGRTLTSLT